MNSGADGSRSEGFRMKALPQASATGNIHIGTMQGKLNGVMPATTPSGWRSEWLSTLVPTFSVTSPFSRCGMPTANSTTSSPRVTSPSASSWVLPCSAEISSAILSAFSMQQELELVEDARAAQRRGLGPGRPGRLGDRDDLADLLGRGERHPLLDSAGRGVEHVGEPPGLARHALAGDVVAEIGHRFLLVCCDEVAL